MVNNVFVVPLRGSIEHVPLAGGVLIIKFSELKLVSRGNV